MLFAHGGGFSVGDRSRGGHEFCGYLFEKEPLYVSQFIKDILGKTKVQTHFVRSTVKKSNSGSAYSFCN